MDVPIAINYPANLPVSREVEKIKQLIENNQVVIICGETGSGKTTQLPKILLQMGYHEAGMIGHTQPRRVAAKSIAHRIATELNNPELVGYKVRFQDRSLPTTKIKLMTDGILLQEIKTDRLLSKYSGLIIDEAHERSLNIDFILGYLKNILPKRKDLKVIITSATIENEKFSRFFNHAPVLNIEGKTYPVDIIYQPFEDDDEEEVSLNNSIYKAIESLLSIELGNILVFLPGEREIKHAIGFLKKTSLRKYQLLGLYSRQNEVEQNLVFKDSGSVKIIITTNVAETSLTIPGIKYVIDSGLARVKRYNLRTRVEQLQIERISKASCRQRAGRAGRLSHGMCVRLYSEADFNQRDEFTTPELLRSNLSNVILQLIGLRLGVPRNFPFLDMPEAKSYNDGFKILYQLKAIDEKEQITQIGRFLTQLPIDVSFARMLYAGIFEFKAINEILIVVAFLAIIDPREFSVELQNQAREVKKIWEDKDSDFISIINLWVWYKNQLLHKKTKAQFYKDLHLHFLNVNRMREWHELYTQLKELIKNFTKKYPNFGNLIIDDDVPNNLQSNYMAIHSALLTGLINGVGQKDLVEDYYLGTHGKKFYLHPQSLSSKPKWVVASSLVLTSKLFARNCAKIVPEWLIPITRHLVKYSYSDYHYDKKRGEVVARQFSLLYGLVIDNSKVPLAKIDLQLANEIFIKAGIIENQLGKDYQFIKVNQGIIRELQQLEDKFRTSLIIWEDELYNFYRTVVPENIADIRTFDLWCKGNQNILVIDKTDFIKKYLAPENAIKLYPDYLLSNNIKVKLKYIFDPSSLDDGINAFIRIEELNLVNPDDFLWLVPGIIREKLAYIIKLLPKQIKIGLNPANSFITDFLEYANQENNLNSELVSYINLRLNTSLSRSDIEKIPLLAYLKVHFNIIDNNKLVYKSDDILVARDDLKDKLDKIVSKVAIVNEISNITEWIPELNDLLKENKLRINNREIIGFNTLLIKDNSLCFLTTDNYEKALQNTRRGVFYLAKLRLKEQVKFIKQKQLVNFKQTLIYLNGVYGSKEEFVEEITDFIIRMSGDFSVIPSNFEGFNNLLVNIKNNFSESMQQVTIVITQVAQYYHQINSKIKSHNLREPILLQLDDLIFPHFLKFVNYNILQHFPRYLQAVLYRLDKYLHNPERDYNHDKQIEAVYTRWYQLIESLEGNRRAVSRELYDFKYKIEELRVSLFAQELKTQYPVSIKRLNTELDLLAKNP